MELRGDFVCCVFLCSRIVSEQWIVLRMGEKALLYWLLGFYG